MIVRCQACGARQSLDALINSQDAAAAVMAALKIPPPVGRNLIAYLALFRPKTRDLSWDRAAAILADLAGRIEAAHIAFDGRDWPAPLESWVYALDEIQRRHAQSPLELPLKNHNYLYRIISSRANRAEAKAETVREEALRSRPVPARLERPKPSKEAMQKALDQMYAALGKRPPAEEEPLTQPTRTNQP